MDEILREHFEEIDLADFGISLADIEELHDQATAPDLAYEYRSLFGFDNNGSTGYTTIASLDRLYVQLTDL